MKMVSLALSTQTKEFTMWEILNFNTFVTQNVLILFYYIGAILAPFIIWIYRNYFINRLPFIKNLPSALIFFILLLCFEICLRMVFEMMIGYFDIHDYLYELSQKN